MSSDDKRPRTPARLTPGTVIGERFEIEALAGTGGAARVYRARDNVTGAPVAVKALLHNKEQPVSRATREARVLAKLEHPAIVRYITHGKTPDGTFFIALNWLEGMDLADKLLQGPLEVTETVQLGLRVADALAAAHGEGVLHRDLKPANLFLPDGDVARVMLLDFGIAHIDAASLQLTASGELVGTPRYLSPEQTDRKRPPDHRTDYYGLGCVLYECLTGRTLFDAENTLAIMLKVLRAERPRASALRPEIPAELDDLIHSMVAILPDERPESASAIIEALRALGAETFDDGFVTLVDDD